MDEKRIFIKEWLSFKPYALKMLEGISKMTIIT
jgi:hypothetical protein